MRLFADGPVGRFARFVAALIPALALSACGAIGGGSGPARQAPISAAWANGPEADFPVVVGEAYAVAGVTYTPEDVLNYDEVGFLAADEAGGSTVSGSHHTLPLPSYIEVTSLETGRTILVRIERRGPMSGHELVALSPGAMAQLGSVPGGAVRVRRVNPPEDHRAPLRAGEPAPLRMDTPMPLVEVLRRKLPAPNPAALAAAAPQPAAELVTGPEPAMPIQAAVQPDPEGLPPLPPLDQRGSSSGPSAPVAVSQPRAPVESGFMVQAAAFSTPERAQNAAAALGGEVSRAGRYYRVRTGPFATRGEAEASLAKVRDAGYTDARIYTSG
jgi:rare lipoprotein A